MNRKLLADHNNLQTELKRVDKLLKAGKSQNIKHYIKIEDDIKK